MSDDLLSLNLPFLSCTIKAIVSREINWNSFPGSVIHGILGYTLKDNCCVIEHRDCRKCYLIRDCNYGIVYESPLPKDTARMKLYPQAPHPIKLAVYPWDRPVSKVGEQFEVSVILYGKATISFLLILLSLERAFTEGIGRKAGGTRGSAVIISISDDCRNKVHDWISLKANYHNPVSVQPLSSQIRPCISEGFSLHFRSPLKLVTEGKVNFRPTVRDITANILRKLGNLYYFYEGNELRLDFERILNNADKTKFESNLKKVSAIRYSSRQSKTISVGGLIGGISVRQCPEDVATVLSMGSFTGAGKSTAMGLGDYRVV